MRTRIGLLIFAASLCLASLFGSHASSDPLEDGIPDPEFLIGAEYVNRTANLRLTVPDGWEIEESLRERAGAAGALVSPDRSVSIVMYREPFAESLDRYRRSLVERLGRGRDLETIDESRLKLDGRAALRLLIGGDREGVSIRQAVTAIADDGYMALILAAVEEPAYEATRPTLDAIADSYRVLSRIGRVPDGVPSRDTDEPQPGFRQSELIRQVQPIYPPLAIQARVSGIVSLKVLIDEQGSVVMRQVVDGHFMLRDAALESVRQWAYTPTLLNGKPVQCVATVTVKFVLKSR